MTNQKGALEQRLAYEEAAWDQKAHLKSEQYVDGATDRLLKFLETRQLGLSLRGARVLDCGCGVGDLSLALARQGAWVVGTDVSPESISMAREHARRLDLSEHAQFKVMPLETMEFDDETFDLVLGKWILHHVELEKSGPEIHRVLKPGGMGVFLENNARNRLLMAARSHLAGRFGIPKKSDDIEYPLRPEDIEKLRPIFAGGVKCVHAQFFFFRMFDKYIFRCRFRPLSRLCGKLDRGLFRILPFLGRYSYRQIVILKK